jgi:hypothetical protein
MIVQGHKVLRKHDILFEPYHVFNIGMMPLSFHNSFIPHSPIAVPSGRRGMYG